MVIFDEKDYVEKNMFKSDYMLKSDDDLFRLIRYYTYHGYSPVEIREAVLEMECGKIIKNKMEDDYYFAMACTKANCRKLRINQPIDITEYEYEVLRSVGDVEKEKILLTLFVVQKIKGSNVFHITNKEIKELSNTQLDKSKIKNALSELERDGFITTFSRRKFGINRDYSKVVRSSVKFSINDYNNITLEYLRTLRTKEYFYCETCGRKILINQDATPNERRRIYCLKCSKTRKHTKKD